jgi:hypothetical protein
MENNLSPTQLEQVSKTIRDWLSTSGTSKNWGDCKEYWIKDVSENLLYKLQSNGYDIVKIKT